MILIGMSSYLKDGRTEIKPKDFVKEYPDMAVEKIDQYLDCCDTISITEHEPELFKKIRSKIIDESTILQSVTPSANF